MAFCISKTNDTLYLRCISSGCKARANVKNDEIQVTKDCYNHEKDPGEVEKYRFRKVLRISSSKSIATVKDVYYTVAEQLEMPFPLKNLYFATSVEELQEKADIKESTLSDKETSKLCKAADTLFKEAEKHYGLNDEELAYIYYFRFVELLLNIQQRSDFEKQGLSKHLTKVVSESLNRATELKLRLTNRYAALKEAQKKTEDDNLNSQLDNKNTFIKKEELIDNIESTSKCSDLVIDTSVDHSISVVKLLSLLTDHKSSLVIMDTRSSDDFEESHIKHSSCVSIPSKLFPPGTTAKHLERILPEASVLKWRERYKVDHVVLIDWDITDTCLPSGHPLRCLEEAMCKWDLQTPLTKPPLILKGGYKEWILRYPMYSTKALNILSLDTPMEVSCITDVSDIEFPDFDEAANDETALVMDKNKKNAGLNEAAINNWITLPSVNRQSKPREQMSNVFSKITEFDTPFKSADELNSKGVDISSAKLFQPASSDLSTETVKVVPRVNRNLKPSKLFSSDIGSPNQKEGILKFKRSISEEEAKENELSNLRLRKKLEAEKSKIIELQKQEAKLLEAVKLMEQEKQEKKAKCTVLEEENKRLLQVASAEKEKKEKELKEFEQKRKLNEQEKYASDKLSNGTHTVYHKENDFSKDTVKKDTGKCTVSLKNNESKSDRESSSQGLTRSYSSPNIAQLISEPLIDTRKKLPTVDRSLKPKIDSMFPPLSDSQLRIRTLNPIYGNCPARPVTGLRNLGNTCFMNSIIQCLSNTERIANYFTTEQYRHHVRRNNRHGSNGEVAEEFAVVIRALHAGTFKSIFIRELKNTLSKYIPMCAGSEQQDSHEFFLALYEQLHGDLNQGDYGEPMPDLDSVSENIATERFWKHHRSQNRSKLSDTFEGLLKSTLSCLSCRKTSNSYEVFSCLSLPISSSRCTLMDCLISFLKPEKMSGEGAWHCPACKQKKEAEKRLSVCKLPNVLIIQLKRFGYDGMWKKKLQCSVEFQPVQEIQTGEFYELYAIVEHFGYLEGGHYTASCKNAVTGRWYKYDDHEVSEINLKDIKTNSAYLLFYAAREKKY